MNETHLKMEDLEQLSVILYEFTMGQKPRALIWYPNNIPKQIIKIIGLKSSAIISGEKNFFPQILLIFPINSINKKVLIKYFERKNFELRDGKRKLYSINFIFNADDDYIFYRYMSYIDTYFNETIQKISKIKNDENFHYHLFQELKDLRSSLLDMYFYLKAKSNFPVNQKNDSRIQTFDGLEEINKFKVIILGDPGIGKTSTILRLTDNVFMRAYVPTMGLNITKKRIRISNFLVELVLWDIGGQTRFNLVRRQFYEGARAFIIMYDVTRRETFDNVHKWHIDLKNFFPSNFNLIGFLIGNKIDLITKRVVELREAIKIAHELGLEYFEVSALTGYNVSEIFKEISRRLIYSF
ncbi:MAG: Rab family GTPase [Promethearchaeota archaeon]